MVRDLHIEFINFSKQQLFFLFFSKEKAHIKCYQGISSKIASLKHAISLGSLSVLW